MVLYLLKRVGGAIVVLWAVITITFVLMHAIPGGPFTQEKKLPPAVLTKVEARYHLDDPLSSQYVSYLEHAAVLDLGPSYKYPGKTVNDIIGETFPVSAELGLISLCLALGTGVLAGMAIGHRLRSGNSRRPKSPRPPNFRGQTVQETLDRYTAPSPKASPDIS